MRIAIGGIATESCSFSPLTTRYDDFERLEGSELLRQHPDLPRGDDVSFVPTIKARALPGGPVQRTAYDSLRQDFLARLESGAPWDGVWLDLHGAMKVVGAEDAEGDLCAAVRDIVGKKCVISASYDLHGNLSERVMDSVDLVTAFRTAPHVDESETRARAVSLLLRALRENVRPHKAWVRIPALLPGERTSTDRDPAKTLYARLPEIIGRDGLWDASILVGYAWGDEPRTGATVVALGEDRDASERIAHELAQSFWELRTAFDFGVPKGSVDECIEMARAAPEPCVFISDSGDNPTAGGAGDVPYVLERLRAAAVTRAVYAGIVDPEAVAACREAGPESEVEVTLGGKLDPRHGTPLPVRGRVLVTREEEAVLEVAGTKVILTSKRTAFHELAQFHSLGIDPLEHEIVAIKIGYLSPELRDAAPKAVLALSPGAVHQDLTKHSYERVERPIFPFDRDMEWQP